MGRTSAAISDLERGKVQISAADLLELADLLNKPIEYFYGVHYGGDDISDLIAIIRKMPPEARAQQLPMITMMLQMLDLGAKVENTTDETMQLELAKQFYNLFLPFSTTMSKWISQLNEIRANLEEVLGINK